MIKYINSLDTGGQFETDFILARKINEIIKYLNDNKIKNNNYISKDKIREKIKEIHDYTFMSLEEREQQDYAITKLEELLEVYDEQGNNDK